MLGPILYSMYTSPLIDIISKYNMNHHLYADDSQISLSFKPSAAGEPSASKQRIESRIHDVNNWMSANRLMLNATKLSSLFCTLVIGHNPPRIYPCLFGCYLSIKLSKEHRCLVQHCHVYGQTNKQHMSVCFL